ncbi:MAG TPA: hypothetical protein VND92_08865, partial [Vicinamibacterales bacterium]|nr:hypothetical protein [Vicinamibacterales bacterium]
MHQTLRLSLVMLVAFTSVAFADPPSALDRAIIWIGPEPVVELPITDTTVPNLFLRIGRGSHVPLGMEASIDELPPQPPVDPGAPPTFIRFGAMTVREAFDTLVKLDPRYAWRDLDGVAVLRPVKAWADPHHFLNRSIGTIEYDKTSPEEMMNRIVAWMYGEQPRDRLGFSQSGDYFPLEVKEGTVLMALVATAKVDGDLFWWIQYPGTVGLVRSSGEVFRLWYGALDRRGFKQEIRRGMPPRWEGTTS